MIFVEQQYQCQQDNQDNDKIIWLSNELIMQLSHRKEFLKLILLALALYHIRFHTKRDIHGKIIYAETHCLKTSHRDAA